MADEVGATSLPEPFRLREGFAHGRFQVLHTDHLEYLLAAAERCTFLHVGITQPFLDRLRPSAGAAVHRHDPTANPLTYEERRELVTRALVGAGLEKSAFAVCPFPIEQPELLTDLIPLSVTAFTTVCDEWNVHKIEVLRQLGYDVRVLLWRGTQRITGSAIRRMIGQGNPEWTSFVPAACRDYLLDLDIAARLSAMKGRKEENDARLP